MEGKLMWCTITLVILCIANETNGEMTSDFYKRQCIASVTERVIWKSRDSKSCAQACSVFSADQCHGFIYEAQSRSCQLLPRASISLCSCSSGKPGRYIMVIIK